MSENAASRPDRKSILLRLDPSVHDALSQWAAADLMSTNAKIDMLIRDALRKAGRLPRDAQPPPKRGRPRKTEE